MAFRLIFLVSSLSASAAALPVAKAQNPSTTPQGFGLLGSGQNGTPLIGSIASSILPKIRFDSAVSKLPQLQQNAKRVQYRYGPVHLVGKNDPLPPTIGFPSMDKHGQSYRVKAERGFCSNCTVLYGKTEIQNVDGSEAADVYVHHFLALDISKTDARTIDRCPSGTSNDLFGSLAAYRGALGSGFIGQGDDNGNSPIFFTTTDGKFESGFHLGINDNILIVADLVNYDEKARDVYLTFDLEYIDGHVGQDATSELLSVGGCSLLAGPKVLKDAETSTKSPSFKILQDGYIVSAKGHMHDGGEKMLLYVNGKPVCTSTASYKTEGSSAGMISDMSRCGKAIPVKKGDSLTIESIYDLRKHPPRHDVQGHEAEGMMSGMDYMGMWALTFTVNPNKG